MKVLHSLLSLIMHLGDPHTHADLARRLQIFGGGSGGPTTGDMDPVLMAGMMACVATAPELMTAMAGGGMDDMTPQDAMNLARAVCRSPACKSFAVAAASSQIPAAIAGMGSVGIDSSYDPTQVVQRIMLERLASHPELEAEGLDCLCAMVDSDGFATAMSLVAEANVSSTEPTNVTAIATAIMAQTAMDTMCHAEACEPVLPVTFEMSVVGRAWGSTPD